MELLISERLHPTHSEALRYLATLLSDLVSNLSIDHFSFELVNRGWVKVKFFGEDEEAFRGIVKARFGEVQEKISDLQVGDICRGFVTESGEVKSEICVDIGGVDTVNHAKYSLQAMRAQLTEDATISARQIANRFCLHDGFPVEVRLSEIGQEKEINVELTDREASGLREWETTPLERLVVIGAVSPLLEKTMKITRVDRSIAHIDHRSLLTHVLICKLDTKANVLFHKVAPLLHGAKLYTFKPRCLTWAD